MEPGKPVKAKRIYLINRDFQLRYTRLALLVGLCSTVMTMALVLFPLVQFRVIRFPTFLPPPFLWAMAAAAFINFLIVALLGVLVTHKIAGPIFSLTRHMHQLEAGQKLTPVHVRATDDLKYLVRSYNGLIDHLRQVALADVTAVEAVIATFKRGESAEACEMAEALKNKLAERL